jgi:hypothetical protein
MAKATPDDYEAVRTIVETLEAFETKDQERILRWTREKLGLTLTHSPAGVPVGELGSVARTGDQSAANTSTTGKPTDIKTFVDFKNPQSDSQFAATVAYYWRFEAPEPQRKLSLSSDDLQDACRQTGRERFTRPAQTLINAHTQGYMDKGTERGTYVVNTVGENLVAMALPDETRAAKLKPRRKVPKKGAVKPRKRMR